MVFPSKRDAWLVWLIRGIPVAVLTMVVMASWNGDPRGPLIGVALLILLELAIFEWVLKSTYYVIEDGTLEIHCSFLRWRIPIAGIRSIKPTRDPSSSPALSLDRLRIDYGTKHILVSPEDRGGFVDALRSVNPAIPTIMPGAWR